MVGSFSKTSYKVHPEDVSEVQELKGGATKGRTGLWRSALGFDNEKECVGDTLPFSKRLSFQRIVLFTTLLIQCVFSSIVSVGYMVHPNPPFVLSGPGRAQERLMEGKVQNLREGVHRVTSFEWKTTADRVFCSASFAAVSVVSALKVLQMLLCRRRRRLPLRAVAWPSPEEELQPNERRAQKAAYWRYQMRPGSRNFWIQMNCMESIEVFLQFARLMAFGGYDLIGGKSIPAETDLTMILQTCLICMDLSCIGVNMLCGSFNVQTGCEVALDVLYVMCPVLAAGDVFNVGAWHKFASADSLLVGFLPAIFGLGKLVMTLDKRDKLCMTMVATESDKSRDPSDPSDAAGAVYSLPKGLAVGQLLIRIACAVGLMAWVFPAVLGTDCPSIEAQEHWHCVFLTHPLAEQPHCNCRSLVSLQLAASTDNSTCTIDNLEGITKHATTLEHLVVVSTAGESMCSVSDQLMSRLPEDIFLHAKLLSLNGQGNMRQFPDQLRHAEGLEQLSIQFASIEVLPAWFLDLAELTSVDLAFNPVCQNLDDEDAVVSRLEKSLAQKGEDYHFACKAVGFIAKPELTSNSTQAASNTTSDESQGECSAEQLDKFKGLKLDACSEEKVRTKCTLFCKTAAVFINSADSREPKGALDAKEANSVIGLLGISSLNHDDVRCMTWLTTCQPPGLLPENETRNYLWTSTLFQVGSAVAGDITDCSRCADYKPSLEER